MHFASVMWLAQGPAMVGRPDALTIAFLTCKNPCELSLLLGPSFGIAGILPLSALRSRSVPVDVSGCLERGSLPALDNLGTSFDLYQHHLQLASSPSHQPPTSLSKPQYVHRESAWKGCEVRVFLFFLTSSSNILCNCLRCLFIWGSLLSARWSAS